MNIVPILKVLTESGLGSRRKMADAIKQGRVQVNSKIVEDFRLPVDKDKDRVTVDGKTVNLKPERLVYLVLNKPQGIISTVRDERGRKTVLDILPDKYRTMRLYPIGRLDRDSTGLLLLTNDGELTNRLTHPRYELEKEYMVYISNSLSEDARARLQIGIKLEDGMTSPCSVRGLKNSAPYNYSITMHEGKKRQVRRMFEAVGHHVLALKRVRMGSLVLGELGEGEVRELSRKEARGLAGSKVDAA